MRDSDEQTNGLIFEAKVPVVRWQPLEDQVKEAIKRAPDPSVFDNNPPYLWRAECSSTRLDSYFTHMSVKTLRNFVADAKDGVPFQNSHRTFELPFGHSFDARYVPSTVADGEQGIASMEGDFYTLPGMNINGINTDELIKAFKAGIARDVSVGFYRGQLICDLDGLDYWRGGCMHIMGVEYDVSGAKKQATGTWDDSHLSEVSSVYNGATPKAQIIAIKADQLNSINALDVATARMLEERYTIRIAGVPHAFPGATLPTPVPDDETRAKLDETPTAESEDTQTMNLTDEMKAELTRAGIAINGDDVLVAIRRFADEIVTLKPRAEMGDQYRTDLINKAIEEGVRAQGAEFAADTYRGMLANSGITPEAIKRMTADWKAIADKTLVGGRLIQDGSVDTNESRNESKPSRAYAG